MTPCLYIKFDLSKTKDQSLLIPKNISKKSSCYMRHQHIDCCLRNTEFSQVQGLKTARNHNISLLHTQGQLL